MIVFMHRCCRNQIVQHKGVSLIAVAHSFRASGQHDELTEWLSQPLIPTEDLLYWWLANQKLYLCLSWMAIDIHMAPGMFLDISHGWILINHLCNRLWLASICSLMCFGDWCHVQLVSDVEMAAALSALNAVPEKKKEEGWMKVCMHIYSCTSDRVMVKCTCLFSIEIQHQHLICCKPDTSIAGIGC